LLFSSTKKSSIFSLNPLDSPLKNSEFEKHFKSNQSKPQDSRFTELISTTPLHENMAEIIQQLLLSEKNTKKDVTLASEKRQFDLEKPFI